MQGQILQVDNDRRVGLILGSDGKRYDFAAAEWRGANPPLVGMAIDFIANDNQASAVFPLTGNVAMPAAGGVVVGPADNSVTLGWLGVGCLVLSFIIPVLPTIGAFVLGLIGSGEAKKHGNGTGLLLGRISWIGALVITFAGFVLIALGLSFLGFVAGDIFREMGNWAAVHNSI
jgi:hypothetical protein